MPYDTTLQPNAPLLLAPVQAADVKQASAVQEVFRPGEAIGIAVGALGVGALIGGLIFFGAGRIAPLAPLIGAFAVYLYAIHLASVSWREVIVDRAPGAIALFSLHLAALAAWPILVLFWTSTSWHLWFGFPMALISLTLFLAIARTPASAIYRLSAHVALITAIGVYQALWTAMAVSA